MNLTEQQIYEKVANQELTVEEALDVIAKLNAQSMVDSESQQKIQTSASDTDEAVTQSQDTDVSEELQSRLAEYLTKTILPLFPAASEQDVSMDMNFMDLGLDSLQLTKLSQQFEEAFEIELYPTLFFEYQNIRDLAHYFSEKHREVFERYFDLPGKVLPPPSPPQGGNKGLYDTANSPLEGGQGGVTAQNKEHRSSSSNGNMPGKPDDIAVIGMAGIFADSPDLETFWNNLRQKKDLIREIPLDHFDYRPWFDPEAHQPDSIYCKWGSFIEGVDIFDAGFFHTSPREAEVMDPQLRLLLQVLYTTTEDAGYPSHIRGTKTGMYVGVCCHDYQQEMDRVGKEVAPYDGTGNSATMMANRPSFYFNLTGPSLAVDTACSSSLVALHLACKALQHHECDMAFAAGTNLLLSSWHYRYFCSIGALTHTGRSHTFDKRADGYVPGEGVGAVLLKPLQQAIADGDRIHAVIKGSAINHGGYTPSVTAPSVQLEAQVVVDAWQDAGIDPATLGYIEAHGTGTSLGDPVEINGLKRAFEHDGVTETSCAIGSAKAHIGHTEGAAGITGVLKVILSMQHQEIPAMPMFEEVNPYIQLDDSPLYIPQEVEPWQKKKDVPRRAGVSSFGFGGAYAHVVLEEYEEVRLTNEEVRIHDPSASLRTGPHIIVLSARNEERLKVYAHNMVDFLETPVAGEVKSNLAEIAYTLQTGREAMQERLAVVVSDIEGLREKLRHYCQGTSEIKDLYAGNVKTGGAGSDLLLEGREGLEFMKIVIQEQKMNKLARLWVAGVDIDWQLLYPEGAPHRISLPTYPFAKERYWIPEVRDQLPVISSQLHPLLHRNTSSLQEQQFSTRFTGNEFYLSDHQVAGQKVLPGVAYIEMARVAGEIAGAGKIQKITNIVWVQPIQMANQPQEVHISLYPDQDQIDYEVSMLAADNQRVVCSQGKLVYEGHDTTLPESEWVDLDAVKQRCLKTKSGSECYTFFESAGLQYGSGFQSIKELFFHESEALSRLQLPSHLYETFHDFVLHPTLMDGALQTVMGLLQSTEHSGLFLPVALGEVEIIQPLPETCYGYATVVKSGQGNTFDIRLLDSSGQVLVRMQDFSLRVIAQAALSAQAVGGSAAPDLLYVKYVWENEPTPSPSQEGNQPTSNPFQDGNQPTPVLIFDTDETLFRQCKKHLSPEQVTLVTVGDTYHHPDTHEYTINPGNQQDYQLLIRTLQEQNSLPGRIIYLWSKANVSGQQEEFINAQLSYSIYPLLYLSQALMAHKERIRLVYLYDHPSDTGNLSAFHAAVSGFARTIRLEHPKLVYKTLEVENLSETDAVLNNAIREFQTGDSAVEIRYDGGQRQIKRFREFDPKTETVNDVPLKENGVYLITGGLGGLGLIFADYLARQWHAKLVLAGRSELSAEKEARLQHIRALGAEVMYVRADVATREDVQRLMAETTSRFGALSGIIHAAGVLRDAFILTKTPADLDVVLRPKIHGTLYLDDASKDEPLDFFVLFSSIAGVMGNVGQCDYAYANSFLDQFAGLREEWRNAGTRSGQTLSINWPLWREGGMHMDEQTEQFVAKTIGVIPLETNVGLHLFEQGLALQDTQCLAFAGNFDRIRQTLGLKKVIDAPETPEDATQVSGSDEDLVQTKIQEYLVKTVSDILKVSRTEITLDVDMSEYGFDSISLTEFANHMNETYENLDITPAIFFEHPTLESFLQFLYQEHKERFIQYYSSALTVSAPVQGQAQGEIDRKQAGVKSRFQVLESTGIQKDGLRQLSEEPIAIIGMSGVMPQSPGLDMFWKHLEQGDDLISEIPSERWNWKEFYGDPAYEANKTNVKWGGFMNEVDTFDALFFSISPREAELMDPQQRIFLEIVWKTIEDAGYKASDLSGTKTGLYVGVAASDYYWLLQEQGIEIDTHTATGISHCVLANRISYLLNLHGPSEPVDTACSSSLVAVHHAIESLRNKSCEMAIAGGINIILSPILHIAFSKAGMLSEDGRCKTFDKRANGYVRGEGAGAILLKPLSRAEADGDHIYALIKGSAVNHGGHANSLTAPNPNAQADLLVTAYEEAEFDPSTVSYIEAHGTGTGLGDPVEVNGLKKAFERLYEKWGKSLPEKPHCGIGSVKTNIGHLETAAGIAGVLKVLLAMKYKKLPVSIHLKELNPYIHLQNSPFYIVKESQEWDGGQDDQGNPLPRRAGVSSFGFGGANAHLVLEAYDTLAPEPDLQEQAPAIFVLSAKDKERLQAYAGEFLEFLETFDTQRSNLYCLKEIAYTMQVGREAMEERLAVLVSSIDELVKKLTQYCRGKATIESVYTGNALAHKTIADLLLDEETQHASIRAMIKKGDLSKVAQLWVSGVEIDWNVLYPNHTPHRISLPTYPFAKEHYWIPKAEQTATNLQSSIFPSTGPSTGSGYHSGHRNFQYPKLHPMVDRNTSNFQGQKFTTHLRGNEFYLKDHVVFEQQVLPGVAYLEMARAAGEIAGERHISKIQNIAWITPIICEGTSKDVHIHLSPAQDTAKYEITTTRKDKQAVTHSHGDLIFESHAEVSSESIDIERIKKRCPHIKSASQCYTLLREKGLNYGPSFQAIREVYSNEIEALSHLELPSHIQEGFQEFLLHPSLLDGALQTISGLGEPEAEAGFVSTLLPTALGEMTIIKPLSRRCYAYARVTEDSHANSSVMKYDIMIADEAGEVAVNIKDFELRLSQIPVSGVPDSREEMPEAGDVTGTQPPDVPHDNITIEHVQTGIQRIIAGILKLQPEKIDIHKSVESYGVDSIMMMSILRKINKAWHIEVVVAELIDYTTVQSLSEYIFENYLHVQKEHRSTVPERNLLQGGEEVEVAPDIDQLSEEELDRLLMQKIAEEQQETDIDQLSEEELDRLLMQKIAEEEQAKQQR